MRAVFLAVSYGHTWLVRSSGVVWWKMFTGGTFSVAEVELMDGWYAWLVAQQSDVPAWRPVTCRMPISKAVRLASTFS